MRTFIGIPLPDEQRASLVRLQQQLLASGADVRWVASEAIHVTLKFLGEIDDTQRQAIAQALQEIGKQTPSFALGLDGVGAFPSTSAPRVIWVGIGEGAEPLTRLAGAIEGAVGALVCRQEPRPFSPHITLGRVRSSRGRAALTARLRNLAWSPLSSWRVSAYQLYQSVLSPTGPRYTVLAEIPLTVC